MIMKKLTFNEFCYKQCDGLYNPKLSDGDQCTGYYELKRMVTENITPASLEEIERWESNPTNRELLSIPGIKYLRFLHPVLRPYIIDNWHIIRTLPI